MARMVWPESSAARTSIWRATPSASVCTLTWPARGGGVLDGRKRQQPAWAGPPCTGGIGQAARPQPRCLPGRSARASASSSSCVGRVGEEHVEGDGFRLGGGQGVDGAGHHLGATTGSGRSARCWPRRWRRWRYRPGAGKVPRGLHQPVAGIAGDARRARVHEHAEEADTIAIASVQTIFRGLPGVGGFNLVAFFAAQASCTPDPRNARVVPPGFQDNCLDSSIYIIAAGCGGGNMPQPQV